MFSSTTHRSNEQTTHTQSVASGQRRGRWGLAVATTLALAAAQAAPATAATITNQVFDQYTALGSTT